MVQATLEVGVEGSLSAHRDGAMQATIFDGPGFCSMCLASVGTFRAPYGGQLACR